MRKILFATIIVMVLAGLAQAPNQELTQSCIGTPSCWIGGNSGSDPAACTCAQVTASEGTYAGTGLGSKKGYYSAIIANISQNTLPADAANISAQLFVEWMVQDATDACSVEVYYGSAWTVLSTTCQGTESIYSYATPGIDTVAETENTLVKVNYTRAAANSQSLNVDYAYLNISYNRLPQIMTAASDGGSSATSPTQEPGNVVFTITGNDTEGDQYKLLVCDSSGQADGACTATTICASALGDNGTQATCSHATTGESGAVAWRAFACDNQSACKEDGNVNSPYYVNNEPIITVIADDGSSTANPTHAPANVAFTVTATDAESDQYKILVCDSTGQSGGTCTGTQYCASSFTDTGVQSSCTHATTGETSFYGWRAFACDNQSTCIEDGNVNSPYFVNSRPSVVLNLPADASNKSSTTVTFNWTALDMENATLTCNLTVDGSIQAENLAVTNNTPYTTDVGSLTQGDHTWNVNCSDAYLVSIENTTQDFTVDSIEPSITNIERDPATIGVGGNVTVNATVTDGGTGVKSVYLNVTHPNGTKENYQMALYSGSLYQYNLTGAGAGNETMSKGQYTVTAWAQDYSDNSNTSTQLTFNAQVSSNISIEVSASQYGASQDVTLTSNSWIKNTGSTDLTGYLIMKVLVNNGSLNPADWNPVSTIVDDLTDEAPRTISASGQIDLNTIWNAVPWNTGTSGDGTYAVHVDFTDANGEPMIGGDSVLLEASDTFAIEAVSLLSGGIVDPATGNSTTLFNYTVTYTNAGNNPPTSMNAIIDGITYAMEEADPSDTDYTDGKVYYLNKTLSTQSHTYSFEASDGTDNDKTTVSQRSPTSNPQVSLSPGWNMISFPLDTGTYTEALASIAGKYTSVVYWDGSGFADVAMEDQVDEERSYWILANQIGTLEFNGAEFTGRREKVLSAGACVGGRCFVSIGLNSVNGKDMKKVMRGMQINLDYNSIVYYDGSEEVFKSFINDPVGNDYNNLQVGRGYYLQVNSNGCIDCVLDYTP